MHLRWFRRSSPTPRHAANFLIVCGLVAFKIWASESSETVLAPTDGKIVGHYYTNGFFGFSLGWPTGWLPNTPTSRKGPKVSRVANRSADDSVGPHVLFSLAEHPLGTVPNAVLLIMMDEILPTDHCQSAKDVLRVIEKGLKSDGANSLRVGRVSEVRIGSKELCHQLFYWDSRSKPMRQEYFATLTGRHVLVFSVVANGDEELSKVRKLVHSIAFAE